MSKELKTYRLDYGNKKYKDRVTLVEKLDLFEEYTEKTGCKIDGTTVYKGVPIGKMLIQIRSNIRREKGKYSDEVIKRLEEDGLLESVYEHTEERVKSLEEYCRNNLQLWNLRMEVLKKYFKINLLDFIRSDNLDYAEEMQKFLNEYEIAPVRINQKDKSGETSMTAVVEEFKKAIVEYDALADKFSHNVLKEKYVKRLKEAGVGGTFGYKTEIEELSEKTGIDAGRLNKIVFDFGSIDNFRKVYIKFMKTWKVWENENVFGLNQFETGEEYAIQTFGSLKKFKSFKQHFRYLAKMNKVITFFDLNEEGFVPAEENRTLAYIVGLEYVLGLFFDGKAVEMATKNFTAQESNLLNELLENKGKKSFGDIAKEKNLTRTRIMQIKNKVAMKILKQVDNPVWSTKKSDIRRRRFIEKYFESKDIFITQESFDLSEDLKQELLRIIGVDFEKEDNLPLNSEELSAELGELIEDLHLAYQELNQNVENFEDFNKDGNDRKKDDEVEF